MYIYTAFAFNFWDDTYWNGWGVSGEGE